MLFPFSAMSGLCAMESIACSSAPAISPAVTIMRRPGVSSSGSQTGRILYPDNRSVQHSRLDDGQLPGSDGREREDYRQAYSTRLKQSFYRNGSRGRITLSARQYEGQARRIDAHLRSRFPYLVTDIYEVTPNSFVILMPAETQIVNEIAEEFDRSIRFVGVAVKLSNSVPDSFVRHIPSLSERESIGTMVGLPFRLIDLHNLLLSRFPAVDVVTIGERFSPDAAVTVLVATEPGRETRQLIAEFVETLSIPVLVEIQVSDSPETPVDIRKHENPMFIWASRLRPGSPRYVADDERFWFDNIGDIAANRFSLNQFPGVVDGAYRCYFDFSLGESDHLNLRQALLLYDEVWCSLPLLEKQESFFGQQRLTKDDLLEIVGSGRLKFVTTQPEERLDCRLLESIHERDNCAILGRRTTAALLVADVVRSFEQSFLRDPNLLPLISAASEFLAERLGVNRIGLLQIMLWPLVSLRGGLSRVLDIGSKGGPCVSLADAVARLVDDEGNIDVELEAVFAGEPVHLGHALNATVFGPLDEYPSRRHMKAFLGHLLNLHRCFNEELGPAWMENERRRKAGESIVPPLPLFEFDPAIPIRELLYDTGLPSTTAGGRSLYSRLARLPTDERAAEIEKLSAALRELGRRQSGTSIRLDVLDTFTSLVAGWMGVGSLIRIVKVGMERSRRQDTRIDAAISRLSTAMDRDGSRQELHFLSRVQRVASFRKERI